MRATGPLAGCGRHHAPPHPRPAACPRLDTGGAKCKLKASTNRTLVDERMGHPTGRMAPPKRLCAGRRQVPRLCAQPIAAERSRCLRSPPGGAVRGQPRPMGGTHGAEPAARRSCQHPTFRIGREATTLSAPAVQPSAAPVAPRPGKATIPGSALRSLQALPSPPAAPPPAPTAVIGAPAPPPIAPWSAPDTTPATTLTTGAGARTDSAPGGGGRTLQDCLSFGDAQTHMSKTECKEGVRAVAASIGKL